ncbi:predicted sugar nucleotidyltransferase [Paenibacillus popilliae ATCC 14706]|uniref:Predicted sugar nucleotidyltransferase n=1 Tax=Paenibacillus popilliae ATCC 14706 TaxID=1212764 RepID=M9M6Y3_PAEPP|nr:predicted sugar nucleotidyltransferase [Paenibacillus popilliae ATCC 14706]
MRLARLKAAEDGIDRGRTNGDDSVIDAQSKLGQEKQAAEHIGGIMGLAASGIGGVSRMHEGSCGG